MNPSLLTPSPSALLSWMLLSTLLLGACWLFYHVLLRQERCFQFNRRFLLYTPWAAILLPPLLSMASPWLTSWRQSWAADVAGARGLLSGGLLPSVSIRAGGAGSGFAWTQWLLLGYGLGLLALTSYKAWQLLQLWQAARAWPREDRPGYTVVYTGGQRPVSSFGRWVFWDDTLVLSATEAAQVLRHEEAHVQLGHSLERLSLEAARILLWFNPFVHLYPAALELTHELLADQAALGQSAADPTAESYTTLLARMALRQLHPELPLAHSFTQSFTLTRIRMLTSTSPVRRWKQWLLLPLSTALLLLVACEKSVEPVGPTAAAEAAAYDRPPPPPPTLVPEDAPVPPPPPPPAYTYVEQMPQYQGGQRQLLADISKAVVYPEVALAEKLEGRVFVRFIVTSTGSIQAPEVAKGIEYNVTYPGEGGKQMTTKVITPAAQALNETALNAVHNLPGKWTPGRQDGKAVDVMYTVPITFSLK